MEKVKIESKEERLDKLLAVVDNFGDELSGIEKLVTDLQNEGVVFEPEISQALVELKKNSDILFRGVERKQHGQLPS